MKLAVIVTTYNRADALAAVLEGYFGQYDLDFELVVADDGSTPDTRALAGDYAKRAPFPLSHVWQDDLGFRAAAIRNRALATTRADYVLFSDGDCIPLPWFVAAHRRLAEPGWFLSANRVLLSERFTRRVLAEKLPVQRWGWGRWMDAFWRRDVNRLFPLLSLPLGPLRRLGASRWQGAKTCNLSAWRADLQRVNGLDESYSGWGLEDSDLAVRLMRAGVRHKSARFAAPVLHLWHREHDRSALAENQRRLDEILRSGRIEAQRGLSQYI
ncbi:MAG TPA: glycosyltransferase family 2 protein [Burkholderiales bacterium]|nr:glycosyltransferase family 2 protein [Burkholderiales bacterium]